MATLEEMEIQATISLARIIDANTQLNTYVIGAQGDRICKMNQFYISLHGLDHLITVETQDPR